MKDIAILKMKMTGEGRKSETLLVQETKHNLITLLVKASRYQLKAKNRTRRLVTLFDVDFEVTRFHYVLLIADFWNKD